MAVLEGTFRVKTTARPKLLVTADGRGVVSHAGSRLLADLADRTSLTGRLSVALGGLARPRAIHDPGRVLADLAVAVADGAECISDIAVLADQPGLFGPVASDSTVWRLLDRLGAAEVAQVAAARAAARELVWAQRAETAGAAVPPASAAGVDLPGLVLDIDASIVLAHSEKEQAAATFKGTFGYHPVRREADDSSGGVRPPPPSCRSRAVKLRAA
jgi:Transposase DDE domain group 1